MAIPASAARGQPGEVIAQLADRDLGLLPGGHVPDGDGAGLVLRGPVDQRPAGPLVAGPFELAAELAGRAQVDAGAQPRRPGHCGEREAARRVALVHDRDRHIEPGVPLRPGRQHEQQPLDAERAAGRGHVRPAELGDEMVVTAAAGQGARYPIGHHLPDRAGVVAQAAHHPGLERHPPGRQLPGEQGPQGVHLVQPGGALLAGLERVGDPFCRVAGGQRRHQLGGLGFRQPAAGQLGGDLARRELVQLVEREQDPGSRLGRDAEGLQQAGQHAAVVEREAEAADPQPGQHVIHGADDLRVGQRRRGAEGVQVALGELAVPAPARPVRAPDRPDGVALVRNRQLAAVGGGHPRQRHGQVVTQGQVGLAGPLVLAAAQDLEDELVAVLAVLAHEDLGPLEGGGGERLEPVAGEHRPDERERALPGLELAGKEVTGSRGGIELRWHAPMLPDRAGPRHIGFRTEVTGKPARRAASVPGCRASLDARPGTGGRHRHGTTPPPRSPALSGPQASDGPPAAMPGSYPPATAGPGARPGPPGYALWLAVGLMAVISAGDGLILIALASRVYGSSHAWAVAAVFLAVTIPITALAPVAGLLLDRLPPRPVLIAAAAVQAVAALALTQVSGIGAVLALAAGFGVGAAVLQPGLGAIVPRLAGPAGPLDRVSQVGVTRANSYLQAATWGGFTAGPLLAGVLTAAGGTGLALAGVAVIYALGAAGLLALPLAPGSPDGTAGAAREGLASQLSAGLRFLRADADAGLLVLVVGVMVVFANMAVVAEVAFAESVLRAGPTGYSILVTAWTAGMLAGTLAGGRLPGHRLAVTTLAGTVAMGAGITLAATAAHLWQAAAAYAFGGLANGMEVVATRSFLNHRAPEQVAGRVFAVYSGVLFGGASAGMAVAGGLLGTLGPRMVLFLAGGGGLAAGAAGWLMYARHHRAGRAA